MHIREETHYNLNLLHVIFAATSFLLLVVTIVWFVRDFRRPWRQYQREAARLVEQMTSDGALREPTKSGFREIPPPSWDGVIALRGIEIPGFEPDGKASVRTTIDRCITCHVLIDWSEWQSPRDGRDGPGGASGHSPRFPYVGVWQIPTGAVNRRQAVVEEPQTLHLWLPLVPRSSGTASDPSDGNLSSHTDAKPKGTETATWTPPVDATWERWGLALAPRASAYLVGLLVTETAARSPAAFAGLRPGDRIIQIGDTVIRRADEVGLLLEKGLQGGGGDSDSDRIRLLDYPTAAAPQRRVACIRLTVMRGAANPLAGHPRADLYLSPDSPHPAEDFACTICHDGVGPATEFIHAAHFPDSSGRARQWRNKFGWHVEESARYPMPPLTFLQRSCLACHPRVFDLAETGDPVRPAADRLLEGRRAFERYGCYGCHDVTDPDSSLPGDPDILREPPYRGAAAQLLTLSSVPGNVRQSAIAYLNGTDDDRLREKLATAVTAWLASSSPDTESTAESDGDHSQEVAPESHEERFTRLEAARLLRVLTTERRGDMIPPRGPSLRYIAQRRDLGYLSRYITNPTAQRSDARMPRLFGLLEHVSPQRKEELRSFEEVEIAGMAAYLATGPLLPQITPEADAANTTPPVRPSDEAELKWGKRLFETQGCLACHRHPDFPQAQSTFGPDLAGLSSRWNSSAAGLRETGFPSRPPAGAIDRLTAWLDSPEAFNPGTRMPRPQFRATHWLITSDERQSATDTTTGSGAAVELAVDSDGEWDPSNHMDALASGARRKTILRALAAFLLSSADSANTTAPGGTSSDSVPSPPDAAIDAVFREYLAKQVPDELLAEVFTDGLSDDSWEAISPASWADLRQITAPLDRAKKLQYIGRRALRRHGCHGCHDIPGLEDATPIGPSLVNWGSKQPSQLAFDHIFEYLRESPSGRADGLVLQQHDGLPRLLLTTRQREGWLYQKLVSPRSYDYGLDDAKGFMERLRMGEWAFSPRERLALVTFVTGIRRPTIPAHLRPDNDAKARILAQGRALVERLGCDQCHVVHHETWRIECEPKTLLQWRGTPESDDMPDSLPRNQTTSRLDRRGLLTLDLVGAPQRDSACEIITEVDDWGRSLYFFRLRRPALITGSLWPVDGLPVPIAAPQITAKSPPTGGAIADLLYPTLIRLAGAKGMTVGENETWGWTPPSLAHIGAAVRGDWLRRYLLAPYPIRPNVPLAMPRYALTDDQIDILVAYLQTIAKAPPERTPSPVARLEEIAQKRIARPDYLQEAFRILTDGKTYCGKCHTLDGRPTPSSQSITAAPRLDAAADRLRPEYLRAWLSNPRAILPYTAMPVLFPADGSPLDRSVMNASSHEQMEAVLDLLAVLKDYLAGRGDPRAPAENPSP